MPYNFGWVKERVAKLEDFKGKKIRAPGGLYPKMCQAIGATAVSLPVGDLYPALEKGIVDGTFVNGSMLWDYKFPEILRFLTGPRCSYWMMGIAFNKQSYARLPKDVQKIIYDNSSAMVDTAVNAMQKSGTDGIDLFDKSGGETNILSAGDVKKMKQLYSPIFRDWINNMEAKGLPGQKIVDDLYLAFEKLGVKEPFIVAPK
jgi:TRAP-type C4-dicarboxylate transport system substrate-binding protein